MCSARSGSSTYHKLPQTALASSFQPTMPLLLHSNLSPASLSLPISLPNLPSLCYSLSPTKLTSSPPPPPTRCMRRTQANLSYLAAIAAQNKSAATTPTPSFPAIMDSIPAIPGNTMTLDGVDELAHLYQELRDLFPGYAPRTRAGGGSVGGQGVVGDRGEGNYGTGGGRAGGGLGLGGW